MFKRMFGGQNTVRPKGYDEGWKLFVLGMDPEQRSSDWGRRSYSAPPGCAKQK